MSQTHSNANPTGGAAFPFPKPGHGANRVRIGLLNCRCFTNGNCRLSAENSICVVDLSLCTHHDPFTNARSRCVRVALMCCSFHGSRFQRASNMIVFLRWGSEWLPFSDKPLLFFSHSKFECFLFISIRPDGSEFWSENWTFRLGETDLFTHTQLARKIMYANGLDQSVILSGVCPFKASTFCKRKPELCLGKRLARRKSWSCFPTDATEFPESST